VPVITADEPSRTDSVERRATWALALATVVLIFPSFGFGFIGGPDWWNIAFYVAGQAALVLSAGASALTLAPKAAGLPKWLRRESNELLFWAFALLWLAVFLIALNMSVLVIEAFGEDEF
jgi:hypothetical protein